MMYYMTSKEFQNHFLRNENDYDILNAQYVIVSTRILRRDASVDRIISAQQILFPNAEVFAAMDDAVFKERYIEMLHSAKTFLSILIRGSIVEGYNIIFMCTPNEYKTHYLNYLAQFIEYEFGYPVYNYVAYSYGIEDLREYDRDSVIELCNKYKKESEDMELESIVSSSKSRRKTILKNKSKKYLIKEMKRLGLYEKGMSKSDMVHDLVDFL